jgi:hypothetical protein
MADMGTATAAKATEAESEMVGVGDPATEGLEAVEVEMVAEEGPEAAGAGRMTEAAMAGTVMAMETVTAGEEGTDTTS